MKVLFGASVYNHLSTFHKPFMEYFQKNGYEVHAVGSASMGRKEELLEMGIICHDIDFDRFPLSGKNLLALRQLQLLFKQQKFELIHVHTPVAALLIRYVASHFHQGKVLYTAHGFHFYKGAPLINWLLYYPLERLAAKWTDGLITMNAEDYYRGKKIVSDVQFVHGVGVKPMNQVEWNTDKKALKNSIGLASDSVVISYIAELNKNKNQQFLLRNWHFIKQKSPDAALLIIGQGDMKPELESFIVKEQLKDVKVLGYRNDVDQLLQITDVVALLSYREGLPKSIMEAMAAKIPCVVSDTRGLRDLIVHKRSGYLVPQGNDEVLIDSFVNLLNNRDQRLRMGDLAYKDVEPYRLENVLQEYISIYEEVLGGARAE